MINLLECLVLLLSFLCYSDSLSGDFVFDDRFAIVLNKDVTVKENWGNIFFNDFWGRSMTHVLSNKSYRPLTTLSFCLNFRLSGLDPRSYHVLNQLLHTLGTWLFLLLGKRLFKNRVNGEKLAVYSALCFSVHPVHTEAICNIVGRADLLAFIFTLVCMLVLTSETVPFRHSWTARLLVIFFGTSAYLSKETGLLVFPICGLYILLCEGRALSFKAVLSVAIFIGTFIAHLAIRARILGSLNMSPNFTPLDNPLYFEKNLTKRFYDRVQTHWENNRLLLFPMRLSCDYGPVSLKPCTETSFLWLDSVNLCFLRATVLYSFYAFAFLHSANAYFGSREKDTLLAFSFTWFIASMFPMSHLGLNIGTVVAERLLYTPSGPFTLWTMGLLGRYSLTRCSVEKQGSKSTRKEPIAMFVVVSIVGMFAHRSIERSRDWNNERLLFQAGVKTFPNNARMNNNIGTLLLQESSKNAKANKSILKAAANHFHIATQSSPTYATAWHNRGLTFLLDGQPANSIQYFENALKLEPNDIMFLNNYGIALERLKLFTKAKKVFGVARALENVKNN